MLRDGISYNTYSVFGTKQNIKPSHILTELCISFASLLENMKKKEQLSDFSQY